MSTGWVGVDLDGTLAEYKGWRGAAHIGAPIPKMVERIKTALDCGVNVKVFTARVSQDGTPGRQRDAAHAIIAIQEWCLKHLGRYLPITNEKDYQMIDCYDDRCKQVIPNTGELVEELRTLEVAVPLHGTT